ncbi:hypothetical protein MCHI_000191 [Candidatus Magnetoovum chiemensis]|nr:hypothetical protein MCHI_000191 [Candidatus Magnetoovum chiemensis]
MHLCIYHQKSPLIEKSQGHRQIYLHQTHQILLLIYPLKHPEPYVQQSHQ